MEDRPGFYLVSTEDKMIPPDAQRAIAKRAGAEVTEVKGSHAVYVSQPEAVADLIELAANAASSAERADESHALPTSRDRVQAPRMMQ